jgi:hypothetical protein
MASGSKILLPFLRVPIQFPGARNADSFLLLSGAVGGEA